MYFKTFWANFLHFRFFKCCFLGGVLSAAKGNHACLKPIPTNPGRTALVLCDGPTVQPPWSPVGLTHRGHPIASICRVKWVEWMVFAPFAPPIWENMKLSPPRRTSKQLADSAVPSASTPTPALQCATCSCPSGCAFTGARGRRRTHPSAVLLEPGLMKYNANHIPDESAVVHLTFTSVYLNFFMYYVYRMEYFYVSHVYYQKILCITCVPPK